MQIWEESKRKYYSVKKMIDPRVILERFWISYGIIFCQNFSGKIIENRRWYELHMFNVRIRRDVDSMEE